MKEETVFDQAQGVYQLFYQRDDELLHSKAYEQIDLSLKTQVQLYTQKNKLQHYIDKDFRRFDSNQSTADTTGQGAIGDVAGKQQVEASQ